MASATGASSDYDSFVSDWEAYFEEVASFLSSLGGGRLSFARESYTEYVLERLGHCMRSLTTIIDYMEPLQSMGEDEKQVVDAYRVQLSQLLNCLRHVSSDWQAHFDQLQLNAGAFQSSMSYQLPTTRSGQCLHISTILLLPTVEMHRGVA